MKPRTHLPKYEIGAHFLTAKTFQNTPFFRDPGCALIFCEELEAARVRYGFHVLAFVVMPDHIHLLLWWDIDTLPNLTISKVAWAVKGLTAKRVVKYLQDRLGEGSALTHPGAFPYSEWLRQVREPQDLPHQRNWRYKVWQQGAGYDFNAYTRYKIQQKVAYIHANPVRAGLAPRPEDYPWSSAINYAGGVAEGGVAEGGVAEGSAFGYPYPRAGLVRITNYAEVLA